MTDHTTASRCPDCDRVTIAGRCLHCCPMPAMAAVLFRRHDGDAIAALEEAGRVMEAFGQAVDHADAVARHWKARHDAEVSKGHIRRGRSANAVDERVFRDGEVEAL